MNCVILQPSYIPWRGYFHLIQKADVFVFYDDVQYDKHGWRNRNRIKTANGSIWLTIPVKSKGNVVDDLPINTVEIDWARDWAKKHWRTLEQTYGKAPYFSRYSPLLKAHYAKRSASLCDWTIELTVLLANELGLERKFVRASELGAQGSRTARLMDILRKLGASHYISGPSARDYLEENLLKEAGISLEYIEYNYGSYPQLYPPFDPHVSILDLLFMTGPDTPNYIWSSGEPVAHA